MVIPKMARPGARPSLVSQPQPVLEPVSPDGPVTVEVPTESRTDFGFQTLRGFAREPGDGLSLGTKLALATLPILLVAGMVFYTTSGRQKAPSVVENVELGPALPVGIAGWIDNFAPRGSQWGPRISVLRGSQKLTDFRMQFPGQIDSKALGLVFRAQDPKNFYVMKLEIIKPIPLSAGVLTHFAVINGQEQPRIHVPLSMPLRPNTAYAVRLDAVGSSFTAWIQGQKIDQWNDAQIPSGGVGLYSELGQRGTLKGDIAVFTLPGKSQSRR